MSKRDLRARIALLEERVAELELLEERIEALESKPYYFSYWAVLPPQPQGPWPIVWNNGAGDVLPPRAGDVLPPPSPNIC